MTEGEARNRLGQVKTFTSDFRPMKNVLAGRNERSLYKLVVDAATDQVVGIHMIGPDAPEILQAAAIAVKAGLKKADFDADRRAPPDHVRRIGVDALMHDILIIGAGHNGLTCAHYLAKKGLKVAILEAADKVGGAAVTDEFHARIPELARRATPSSLLQPKVIKDMELERHGLKVVLRKIDNFLPGPNGSYLLSGRDGLTRVGDRAPRAGRRRGLRPLQCRAGDGRPADPEMDPEGAARSRGGAPRPAARWPASAATSIGLSHRRNPHRPRIRDQERGRHPRPLFRGRLTKALFAFDGIVGNFASPYTPGTAYVLLHHLFGEAAGVPGAWGHAIGGMGSITQAMAKACREAGVDIVLNAPVSEIIVEKGRAAGVVVGRQELARADASSPGSIPSCCSTGWCPRARSSRQVEAAFRPLGLRKRDLPDERRARQAAEFHRRFRDAAII